MENYDQRRRHSNDDQSQRYSHNEERGRDRESWRGDDERAPQRAGRRERGWLDYDRDYGRSEQRYGERGERGVRDEQRYSRGGSEGSQFSPDWSREGAEPRRSDEPYYSRNRENADSSDYSSGARAGDYNSPDWPYDRYERSGPHRDAQRSHDDGDQSHYRGYYRREATPFAYAGGTGLLYSESLTLRGPYAGRGPRGYKRSDQQLIEEASQRLERDGDIDASDIEVTAEDGVIVLRGAVHDRRTKRRAEECVESVYGARDVMNELRVSSPSRDEAQASQESQGSQASQRSQSARGSQSSPTVTPTPASRAGGSSSEQSEDKRLPKH